MMRDGVFGEYKQYSVTKEQEQKWLTELIDQELNKLDINNKDTLFPLWYILETNCLPFYLDKIIDFIDENKSKAKDKFELLAFISKTMDTIDRIEEVGKGKMLLVGQYRKRIELLKSGLN
ncbi:MAG TPA: hypothetical protein DCY06_13945 [Bacteroidetes bacterium]|nr:hypothetical protein [Bacteroidota bacterium]